MKLFNILESIAQFDEVRLNQHSYDRSLERFLNQSIFPLMLKTKDMGVGQFRKVGNYILSDEERKKIISNVNDVLEFELPKGKSYGVVFHTFDVLNTKNTIFPKPDLKLQTLNDVVRKNGRLYITNKEDGGSIGDTLFGVIRDNTIITFFLNRSHSMSAEKHKVDEIISAGMVAILANSKKEKTPDKIS